MCVVSVPHAHGFQTIPHKNSCRAVCAEMFQNLKLWSSGNISVTISFQIKTDEFCPLLTQRWNTQLWKCRYINQTMPNDFCSASEKCFLAINFYNLFFSTRDLHQMTPSLNVPSSLAKSNNDSTWTFAVHPKTNFLTIEIFCSNPVTSSSFGLKVSCDCSAGS